MVNVLQTVKEFAKGRTVAVFGCGGDRDKTKRPAWARRRRTGPTFAVVTTDNPRTEEPAAIIRDILPGFDGSNTPYEVVEDRVEAIRWAMDHAPEGRCDRSVRQGPRDLSGSEPPEVPHG